MGNRTHRHRVWSHQKIIVFNTHAQFGPILLPCAVTWMGSLAHAQTTQMLPRSPAFIWAYFRIDLLRMRDHPKEAPDPSHHRKSIKKHTLYWSQHKFNGKKISSGTWWQAGRVWGPSDVTPFYTADVQSRYKGFASWRTKSWALDEAIECNAWTLSWTMVWMIETETWKNCLKRKKGWLNPRSE